MKNTSVNANLGVSFSIKCARDFGLEPKRCLVDILDDLHVRRLRLMSYWDTIETLPGRCQFDELDWQMDQVANRHGQVSLAIGLRQPRYPECHIPAWAQELTIPEQTSALYTFLEQVVRRYGVHPALHSYQLENEALNHGIGECVDYSRQRLLRELRLVKQLDSRHPVMMSLSNTFGLPVRPPYPDGYGVSIYTRQYHHQRGYTTSPQPSWLVGARGWLIGRLWRRPVFVHELQAEPWGPRGNQELAPAEQARTMTPEILSQNVKFALATGLKPIDLWGAEWWYWRRQQGDASMWQAARQVFA